MGNTCEGIVHEVKKVICGKDFVIAQMLTAILAGGHILMEDVPGVGKTSMALAFSRTMGLNFGRVQFTPDVLPSDITGFSMYDKATDSMKYQPGAIFHNLFLADELNRASSRTQSALLEAMEEAKLTVDGVTYRVPDPFMVIATQNPTGYVGTYPLPEAQMDRFLMRISMETPSKEDELNILNRFLKAEPLKELQPVCTAEDIVALSEESKDVYVHPVLMKYIVDIAHTSRDARNVATGISPRGSLALLRACRAYAMVKGRDYVVPEDIKSIAVPVLAHRIVINGSISTISEQKKIIENILNVTPLTTEDWKK